MFKLSVSSNKSKLLLILACILVLAGITLWGFRQNRINQQVSDYEMKLIQTQARFEHYHLKNYKETYITIIDQYKSALDSKDLLLLKDCHDRLNTMEADILQANTKKVEKKLKKLRKADISHAYETELKRVGEIEALIEQHLEARHFTSITPLLKEWTNILNNMSFVADNLSISVNQINFTNFPTVSLYLSIRDIETNQTPAYLQEDYLYLKENENALSVLDMEQLEDNERVVMKIAIDTSLGEEDKNAIITENLDTFSKQLDYNIDDKLEIVSEFSTSLLYDNLINELEELNASNSGVKCLITLTDTEDTESTHTWEDVVDLANQYQIPIFMIGVGREVSPYVLERIGTRTNVAYRNIHNFKDLSKILEKIYVQQKAIYKVEYVSDLPEPPNTPYNLHIAYQHRLYGGVCEYEYVPLAQ